MKNLSKMLLVVLVLGMSVHFKAEASPSKKQGSVEGAWHYKDGNVEHMAVFVDGYFSHTRYDLQGKQFISTRGGKYAWKNGVLSVTWQYDTDKAAQKAALDTWLGQTGRFAAVIPALDLQTDIAGKPAAWKRIDSNGGALTAVWRMTGRKQGDQISNTPLRDRRTLKILTGTRFQWVAINIATGEFSGTGGGTYTYENGKYTENIEFFSRDNSRVGASLVFDGNVKDGQWHHSGLSSAGNPIYEIWGKIEE